MLLYSKKFKFVLLVQTERLCQCVDFLLQILQKSAGMGAVHLGVMELEGNRQFVAEPLLPVSAPEQEGVVIDTAVHAYHAVNFRIHNGGGTDDHAVFRQIPVGAGFRHLSGIFQVFPVKSFRIIRIQNIAGTDFAGFVFDDGVDCRCSR